MSSKGVDATAIQEVTDAADVGFGTFYNYFRSKEELAEGVLDCVIHNLGQRNRMANDAAGVVDPLAVIGNSVRLTIREMCTDPMWRWWLKRTDLMVRRMKHVFMPFGIADITAAVEAGVLDVPHGDIATGWSYLIWLIAGTMTEMVEDDLPPEREERMAEFILRALGATAPRAEAVSQLPLPAVQALEIDFDFRLNPPGEEP